jgi:cell wall assembly regulator SMI1
VGSDGYNLCIDLEPGPNGTFGQVILMDRMSGPGPVVAESHAAWLTLWADELEAGTFVADGGALVTRPGRVTSTFPDPPVPNF